MTEYLVNIVALVFVAIISALVLKRQRDIRALLHSLETDPSEQYRFHLWATGFWIVNFPLVMAVYLFLPDVWDRTGLLYTLIVSLYANGATDFGAISATIAAMQSMANPAPGQLDEALDILHTLRDRAF